MKELEPMTAEWYLKGLVQGLILWLPFTLFALFIPIIGWLMIPVIPFFPFIFPFLIRYRQQKKNNKIMRQAREQVEIEKARKIILKGGVKNGR